MQPTGDEVTIDFLEKSTETMDFLKALKAAKMGPATVLNYIKNMIRFVNYLTTYLNFDAEDPDFKRKCSSYIGLLRNLRKPVAKSNTKATCSTRSVLIGPLFILFNYFFPVGGTHFSAVFLCIILGMTASIVGCQASIPARNSYMWQEKRCKLFLGSFFKRSMLLQRKRHCFGTTVKPSWY